MRIDNDFVVPASPEEAWTLLTDLERVAPCLPGAAVESMEGDVLHGHVALRIGPMSMKYAGQARFVFKDDESKVATIEAKGRDGRGGGSVDATIKASVVPVPEGTKVVLSTDLNLTGRVAQLGRGPINEVSSKLMVQFADCLAGKFSEAETEAGAAAPVAAGGDRVEPINLLDKSLVPPKTIALALGGVVAVVVVVLAGRRLWGRRSG